EHAGPDVDPLLEQHARTRSVVPGSFKLFGDLPGRVGAGFLWVVVEGSPVPLGLESPDIPGPVLTICFCPGLRPPLVRHSRSPLACGFVPAVAGAPGDWCLFCRL